MTHPKKQEKTDRQQVVKSTKMVSNLDDFFVAETFPKSLKILICGINFMCLSDYTHACTHAHTHASAPLHTHAHTYIPRAATSSATDVYSPDCTFTRVLTRLHLHTHMHIFTHTHTYIPRATTSSATDANSLDKRKSTYLSCVCVGVCVCVCVCVCACRVDQGSRRCSTGHRHKWIWHGTDGESGGHGAAILMGSVE